MDRFTGGIYVMAGSIVLALIAGICILVGTKGGSGGVIYLIPFGVFSSIPFIVYYNVESRKRPFFERLILVFAPLLFVSLLIEDIVRGRGVIFFLQLTAVILPGFWLRRPVMVIISGLLSGFTFYYLCYFMFKSHIRPFGVGGDDWTVIHSFLIVLVSGYLAYTRAIINRVSLPGKTKHRGR